MCMCVVTWHVCANVYGGQRSASSVFLTLVFETGPLTRTLGSSWASCPVSTRDLLISVTTALGCQAHSIMSSFLCRWYMLQVSDNQVNRQLPRESQVLMLVHQARATPPHLRTDFTRPLTKPPCPRQHQEAFIHARAQSEWVCWS